MRVRAAVLGTLVAAATLTTPAAALAGPTQPAVPHSSASAHCLVNCSYDDDDGGDVVFF